MGRVYYREQKHICGKSYETAPYMEVDLYQVSAREHRESRRAKRKKATTLAQQCYNDKQAKRYHVQLVNTNSGKGIIPGRGPITTNTCGSGRHKKSRSGFHKLHEEGLSVVR